jgi:excisionase family DNA binding protein
MIKRTYTTFDIAKLLDVYPTTVANWADDGKLKAYNTPGGHRRVLRHDLLQFFQHHNMPLPSELAGDHRKVLIVDDDRAFVKAVVGYLQAADGAFELYTAYDGFAAGQQLAKLHPDTVVLDLRLPGIDGFKICERIKQEYPGTTVIAVTGYDSEEYRRKIIDAGADAYLAKPFRMAELLKLVGQRVEMPA